MGIALARNLVTAEREHLRAGGAHGGGARIFFPFRGRAAAVTLRTDTWGASAFYPHSLSV